MYLSKLVRMFESFSDRKQNSERGGRKVGGRATTDGGGRRAWKDDWFSPSRSHSGRIRHENLEKSR